MKKNRSIINLITDETAQGLVEYSLLLSLIALVVIGALVIFGETLLDFYNSIKGDVEKL